VTVAQRRTLRSTTDQRECYAERDPKYYFHQVTEETIASPVLLHNPLEALPSLKLERNFLQGPVVIGQGVMALN